MRPLLIPALLAAVSLGIPSPSRGADGTWTLLPYLPWGSNAPQILVDDVPRHRLLLIGDGQNGTAFPLVWARPKDGSSGWAPLPSVNTPWAGAANVILDPVRDRLVIWDGANMNLLTASLSEPLVWSTRRIPNGPNVWDSAVAYDAARRRMLVFSGGGTVQSTPDVYALPLDDDNAVWSTLHAEGPAPTARMNAVAVVDPVHDRLIIHGGRDFSSSALHIVRGDVWALSLSDPMRWTPLFTDDMVSELCYAYHSAVYDPVRQRLLLFGGGTGDYLAPGHAEVRAFALDGSNVWSIAAAPDSVRGVAGEYNAAVYDSASDAVFDFDANYYPADQHATYRLALSPSPSWSLVERNGEHPPWRFGQATAFDPIRDRWLSFGGRYTYYVHYDYPTTTYNDLWSVSIGDRPEWTALVPLGAPPPERQDGSMLYDPRDDQMILFGGQVTTGVGERFLPGGILGTKHFDGDTWSLGLSGSLTWSRLALAGPAPRPRDGHVMVLDSRRHRVLVFGGRDSNGAMNDLWALSLDGTPAWAQLTPAGSPPAPRWEAVGCYDATEDRLVIAGGVDSTGQHPDAFELHLGDASLAWSALPTTGTPPTVGDHTRAYVFDTARRRILVFGDGNNPEEIPSPEFSSWALDLSDAPVWRPLALGGTVPRASYGNSAAFDSMGDRVLLSGGAYGVIGEYTMNAHSLLSFGGLEAPVSLMLSSLTATSHRVSLDWLWAPTASGILARVERSGPDGAWREIGAAVQTARDHLTYADPDVAPSIRYGYRLRTNQGGVERVSPEAWVTVPGQLQLVMESPRPNPASAGAVVAFDLPQPAHVELSVFDVGGRRRERHAIEATEPGRYSLSVGRDLAPGVYLIQLAAGSQSRTTKLCLVR